MRPTKTSLAEFHRVHTFQRIDYFLIWGHGLHYRDEIVRMIEQEFDILHIETHKPISISRFVKTVYAFDYAPRMHLRTKTKYLRRTPRTVVFIFVKNVLPCEERFGDGIFEHIECTKIKLMKSFIRQRFNPSADGVPSEDHVVHASDNEFQTIEMLRYLGYDLDTGVYLDDRKVIGIPWYLMPIRQLKIKRTSLDRLRAAIVMDDSGRIMLMPLQATPHYRALEGDTAVYNAYISSFAGTHQNGNYSISRLMDLKDGLSYGKNNEFIITQAIEGGCFRILDGLHRAVTLQYKDVKECIIAEVVAQ